MTTTERLSRLRGYRHQLRDADAAQAARLAEIDTATSPREDWSRSEREWWEQRGARARRKAVDEQQARWQRQLKTSAPARAKLKARLDEIEERRVREVERNLRALADIYADSAAVQKELNALEAVPEMEIR